MQYDYTHDQLNTRHYIISFFFGGGAQNLSLPPGASYPRYATDKHHRLFNLINKLVRGIESIQIIHNIYERKSVAVLQIKVNEP